MDHLIELFKLQVVHIFKQLELSGAFKGRQDLCGSQQVFLDKVMMQRLADSEWPATLYQLTIVLHTLHKRQVVLLVDEYDTPTSHAAQHGYLPQVCMSP
jgi:hypothetical protein